MNERTLLAGFLKSRKAFECVYPRLERDRDLTEQGTILLDAVRAYYERDPEAACVDPDLFKEQVALSIGNPKHKSTFKELVERIYAIETSPANILDVFYGVREDSLRHQITSSLMNTRDRSKAIDLMEEYIHITEAGKVAESGDEVLSGTKVSAVLDTAFRDSNLIKVPPKALNDRIGGGAMPGRHIVLFGRPEVGKTQMVINMAAGFLAQGLRTLYVGNEDPLPAVLMRFVCRLCKMTEEEVRADPSKADSLAREKGYDNLVLVALAPGTPSDVERLVREFTPAVVCVDQLRNLNTGQDNQTQSIERAARRVRDIGKKYGLLVVSVTQAGESASGKSILDMGDIDMSNTGVPGTADLMVGIGATQRDLEANRMVISLPKNKLSGNHTAATVLVDPKRHLITSL